MPLQTVLNALASLLAMATAGGLLLNVAAQPASTRSRSMRVLAPLCAALLLWAFFVVWLHDESALTTPAKLAASTMTLTTLLYFVYVNQLVHSEMRLASLLVLAAPVVLVVNLILVWTGGDITAAEVLATSTRGLIVFVLLTLYAAAAFWQVMISRSPNAPQLRVASLLAVIGCASPIALSDALFSVALLLMGIAIGWIGGLNLRAQIVQPFATLREELRIANADLRQATSESASLRGQNDILNRELQASGQYRSEFLNELGHKLRTPLNSIAGYTELLQSGVYGDLNETQRDRLGKIQRNGETLLEVISNMLDLNKIDAGQLQLAKSDVALNPLIDEVLEPLSVRRREKGLSLTTVLAADLPSLSADAARLSQILMQLFDNAYKFTLKGGVIVRTRCIHVQNGMSTEFTLPMMGWLGDGDWLLVEVEDTGIGIAPENQARVFDAFYQVADPRTDDNFGTGLGLAIAKRLAELHEGTLWLKSMPDQGSTFYLALRSQRPAKR